VLPDFPQGTELAPGLTADDTISKIVNTLPPAQLLDILASMQNLAVTDPGKAQVLLDQAPQLSYAIFQALLLLNLVDSETLRKTIVQATAATQAAPPPQAPPQQQYIPPPQQPPQQYQNYQQYQNPTPVQQPYAPPPQQQPPPQPQQAAGGPDRNALIAQVMGMTEQQISALRPEEQAQIRQLRAHLQAGGSL
jgi:cleavage stimulation factor subunit 2